MSLCQWQRCMPILPGHLQYGDSCIKITWKVLPLCPGVCVWVGKWGGGGGGLAEGYFGSQVTGMIEWGQKSKPKKIPRKPLDQKINPQKSNRKFQTSGFGKKKKIPSITPVVWNQVYPPPPPGLVCCSTVCGALIATTRQIYQQRVRQ